MFVTQGATKRQKRRHHHSSLVRGSHVEGNFQKAGKWFPGVVRQVRRDGTFDLVYADGDREQRVHACDIRWADLYVMDLPFYDRNLNPYHHPESPRWLTYAACYGPLRRFCRVGDWVAVFYKRVLRAVFRVDKKIPYKDYMTGANAAADALYYQEPSAMDHPKLGKFRKKQGGQFAHVHQNVTPRDQPKDVAGEFVLASYTWNAHRPGFAAGTHPVPEPPLRNYEIHEKTDVTKLIAFVQTQPVPLGQPPVPNAA